MKDLDVILLSHLHIDHTADMSAVFKTIYLHNFAAKTKRSATKLPIKVFGPAKLTAGGAYDSTGTYVDGHYHEQRGLERYIYGFARAIKAGEFAYTTTDIPANKFKMVSGVKSPVDITTIIQTRDGLTVKAIGVDHGPVPSVAYRIEYKGKSIVYSGDTTSKMDNMIRLSDKADILIYDTALTDDLPPAGSVFRKFHTSPSRMGEIAQKAKAKKLIFSHISPITEKHLDEVKKAVIKKGYTGSVITAKDLAVYNM
ncbi:MAG: MBL fold metallo-hydrolase [Ectothiorhodospiraceae bacterium]|nr:MBL fold metallo-hydrolase [Ectothiorhodospiraceae bacterium]